MRSIWIFSFSFLFFTCSKEDKKLKCDTCFADMYLNGISWQGDFIDANILDEGFLSVSFTNKDEFGQNRESLTFGKILPKVGIYTLSSGPITLLEMGEAYIFVATSISDGDVLGATYNLLEEESHELNIQLIDLEEKIVEGSFKMTLVKDIDPGPSYSFPDTVRITQGVFRSDIRTE